MGFAGWVRDRLWHANNWCAVLTQLRQALGTERRTPATIQRMFEVACATEYCDPDRGRALTLYLDAWRNGHPEAGDRAKHLATELGAHMALAEIAKANGDLLTAGTAYLDAGFRELAAEPLQKFVDTRPPGASAVTENLRTEGITALLAIASGRRFDAEAEIHDSLARARHATGRVAAAAYVHAARVARACRLDERIASILLAATHACPDDDTVAGLVEARLFETGKTDDLLAHYSKRLELTSSRGQYAERARAAGVQLIALNLQPGLGLRLLRMGLEHAYNALLPDITSHIAAWELLSTHAHVQSTTLELIPLLEQALAAPLPEEDALYLAQLGLEISWRQASDIVGAKPYAAMLLDFAPEHPLAVAFVTEAAPEMIAEAEAEAVEEALPLIELADAPPTPAPVSTTSRIPVLEGQVKRAEDSTAAKKPHVVTGRMALLKAPAPQVGPPAPAPAPSTPPPSMAPRAPASSMAPRAPAPSTPPKAPPAPAPKPSPPSSSAHLMRSRTARRITFVPATRAPQRTSEPTYPPRAPRKVMPVDVVVELSNGSFFSTVLRDLSTSGAFVVTKRPLEVGTVITLELKLPKPGSVTQTSHRVTARTARRSNIGCGVAFIDATPELVDALRAI